MNRFIRLRLLGLASMAVLLAGPAAGQGHRSAVGLTVGGSVHGDLTPGLSATTRLESGWIAGIQYEHWFGTGRTGVRLNTLYTQRMLDDPVWHDYNVFMADVDLMVRLLQPEFARRAAPYLAVGAGATHYGSVAGTAPLGDGVYGQDVVRAHLLTALGVDIAAGATTGVRLEVGDQIVLPSIGHSPTFSGFPNVHNLVATIGMQLRIGSLDLPRRRFRRPAPTPAEPPAAPEAAGGAPDAEDREQLEALQGRMETLNRELARLELRVEDLNERVEQRPAPTPAVTTTLYTVQVGSFLEPDRADRLVAEVRRYGLPVWRWDAVTRGMTFSRVRAGAVTSEAEAERLATRLQRQHGLPVWVDEIDGREGMPAGAVARTRSYLESGG